MVNIKSQQLFSISTCPHARSLFRTNHSFDSSATAMESKRFYCGHCDEKVSKTLYYQHKKLYYCSTNKSWIRPSRTTSPDPPEDFRLSDSATDGEL